MRIIVHMYTRNVMVAATVIEAVLLLTDSSAALYELLANSSISRCLSLSQIATVFSLHLHSAAVATVLYR
jgi:hypothetical protein